MPYSKRSLQKILTSCAFNPKEPGPLAAILDSSTPEFLVDRTGEFLREAKQSNTKDRVRKLQMSISLLAMAVLQLTAPEPKPKARKARVKEPVDTSFLGSRILQEPTK